MSNSFVSNWQTQMRKGLLELTILNVLAGRRLYGLELVKRLQGVPGLVIGEGTIYPIMSRLSRDGLVAFSLEPSPDGPARKYYRLSSKGRSTLERMNHIWNGVVCGITKTMEKP